MIKNVLNLIDYIETTEILYIIIFLELLEICITITSIFFFFFRYYSNIEIKVIFKNFKKTDIKNQLFTIWFTLRYAIPNRILINNTWAKYAWVVLIFIFFVLLEAFPPIILLYFLFWKRVGFSYYFAIFYKQNKFNLKKKIDSKLFNNQLFFAENYFKFFWGNMFASSKHAVRSGLGGSALGIFYQMSKMHEKSHLRDQTSKELIETVAVALNKPEDVIAVQALRKSLTKDVRARDCPILHMEDTVWGILKDTGKKAWEIFVN